MSYRFSWGNGDTSEWGGWTQSGTPGGAMYAYPGAGTFQVRAQARDANEALSVWSNPLSVTIHIPVGTLKWNYQTGSYVSSSPAVAADGTVYVGSGDSYLYAIYGDSPLADSPWPKFHHNNKNTGRVGGGR